MKHRKKFNTGEEQEAVVQQQAGENSSKEFSNAEELLRYDAANTAVPASVAKRLQESTRDLPAPSRSWWQRFFGGGR